MQTTSEQDDALVSCGKALTAAFPGRVMIILVLDEKLPLAITNVQGDPRELLTYFVEHFNGSPEIKGRFAIDSEGIN